MGKKSTIKRFPKSFNSEKQCDTKDDGRYKTEVL
jgi:hypothetical protein